MLKPKKPLNEWGKKFEQLLTERQLSLNEATVLLKSHKVFNCLHRATLYRWMTCPEEKRSSRAALAFTIIQNTPKVNVQREVVQGWIERLQTCDEQLRVTRKEIQDIIAQLTFHQS